MFTTLAPREEKNRGRFCGITQRLRDKIKRPSPVLRRVELLDSYFIDVRGMVKNGAIYDREDILLRQSCRLALCAPGISLPIGYRYAVTPDEVARLQARVLCRTAIQAMNESALPLYCRSIGVIDEKGEHIELLEEFVHDAPFLFVHTLHPERYAKVAARLLGEYGAPVTFCEKAESMRGCTIIMHASGRLPSLYPVIIFSLSQDYGSAKNLVLHSPQFSHAQLETLRPKGILFEEFYTALFERCQIKTANSLCASRLLCREREVGMEDIVSQLIENTSGMLLAH